MTTSWLGPLEDVHRVLAEAGADFDLNDEGVTIFHLKGPVTVGLGGQEVVVGPEANYFIGGRPHSLLDELRGCPSGVVVGVF